jgi:hypothetical protein
MISLLFMSMHTFVHLTCILFKLWKIAGKSIIIVNFSSLKLLGAKITSPMDLDILL